MRAAGPCRDLRISVTDRCNFRCVYCMPKDVFGRDYSFLPHAALLSFEEIARVARVFVGLGVRKIRLTGGEPLLRRKIERLVEMLRAIDDGLDITLTTNGALLARKARDLKSAGLSRVTVSLDSLDDATFRAMNDVDFPVASVLEGIDAAAAAGLTPIKVNMVVKRGANEHSIVDMARHFRGSGHVVRFIEYMDVGATNGWRMDDVVSAREIVRAHRRHDAARPGGCALSRRSRGTLALRRRQRRDRRDRLASRRRSAAIARVHACPPKAGSSHACSPTTASTCASTCARAATTSRSRRVVAAIWRQRNDRYSEIRTASTTAAPKVEMSYIGG